MDHVVSRPGLAITLGLAASLCYALGATLQHRAARSEHRGEMVSASLLVRLVQRKLWLLGAGIGAAGIGIQAFASHFGSLTLIQCLLIGNLVFVVPISAVLDHRRIQFIDAVGVILAGLGLVGFLVSARPKVGISDISGLHAVKVGVILAVAIGICLSAAKIAHDDRRAALMGTAAGITIGTLDALIKSSSDLGAQGIRPLLTNWPIYAFCGVGLAVLLLEQNALANGRLPAAQSGISVLEPVTGILIGAFAFQEGLATGWATLGEALSAVVAITGIVVLSAANSRWHFEKTSEELVSSAGDTSPPSRIG